MDEIQKKQEEEYVFPYHYVSEFRNNFTQTFNDTWGINYVSTIEYIFKRLKIEQFNTLLDMGCGDGRLVKELTLEFPDRNIAGLDFSSRAINLAKALNPNCSFHCLDITKKTIAPVDIITLIEVFEHIPPDISGDFIKGIYNHLNTNGILYITVPHINKAVEYKHYRHFSSESIYACFNDKFIIEEIIPFESNGITKKIIDLILTNRFFILNSSKLKNLIYKYYKNILFLLNNNEKKCNRLFIKAIKR
jgi:cyclopropane fatty-acyl-phospholipid synthase-like methyltransferase